MATVGPLPFNKKDYDFDKDDCEKKDYHNKDSIVAINKTIPMDYLKIIAIVILLTSSVLMFNYEPTPRTIRDGNNTQNQNNILPNNENEETEDNPYGFHPFYQVHKRVQYTNPAINICNNIDPSKTLLLAILSRASNVHIREAIRQTWGAARTYNDIEIRLIFLVGVDDGMIKQIEIEQMIYHGKFY
jgi:hypothetical protein